MIDFHPGDPTIVVAVTVSLGFAVLLISLLVPSEPVLLLAPAARFAFLGKDETGAVEPDETPRREHETFSAPPSAVPHHAGTSSYEHRIITRPPVVENDDDVIAPTALQQEWPTSYTPDPLVPFPRIPRTETRPPSPRVQFTPVKPGQRNEPAPEVAAEPPVKRAAPEPTAPPAAPAASQAAPVTPSAPVERNRRITWTSLVDESAEELDLPTRLKIIEALGLIGGSWSREILARAYEQELDATVRGAIFLALRDSKSAA